MHLTAPRKSQNAPIKKGAVGVDATVATVCFHPPARVPLGLDPGKTGFGSAGARALAEACGPSPICTIGFFSRSPACPVAALHQFSPAPDTNPTATLRNDKRRCQRPGERILPQERNN
ncbi:hypothetical protein GWI33_005082 [Rhynchophorus ferrugineus]|uniref:Uncharacterized protein n=1 Tax=Rhynchophorus ferrugineus TaxID=354439 RepID=A0A834MI94_RHYFE|nr:hypothetical protein GWI33_005082 [Rhynchophorus ferrugineus]